MPLSGDAKPRPKAASLARGTRRYRRKVASPKQWQAIIAAKQGPCRVCVALNRNGHSFPDIQFHHVVSRQDGGDDLADNIAPICALHHRAVTMRLPNYTATFLESLSDAEYAYAVQKGGEGFFERAYGLEYRR